MAQTTLETPSGQGGLYDGPTWLADVQYQLHVSKNFRTFKAPSGMWRLPGPTLITGELELICGQQDLAGTFTLRLADQRHWVCVVKADNAGSGKYQVSNGGSGFVADQ